MRLKQFANVHDQQKLMNWNQEADFFASSRIQIILLSSKLAKNSWSIKYDYLPREFCVTSLHQRGKDNRGKPLDSILYWDPEICLFVTQNFPASTFLFVKKHIEIYS